MKYLFFCVLFLFIFYVCVGYSYEKWSHRDFNNCFLSIDMTNAIKGFAIIIIMLAHMGQLFDTRYLNPLGSWGSAIFLFCSGYGIDKSVKKKGIKGYWGKRFVSVWIPYAIAELILYLFVRNPKSIIDVVMDLTLIKPMHPLGWYLQCIFIFYFAFYIAELTSKKNNFIKYCILLGTSILIFIFMKSLFKQQLLSFTLGVFFSDFCVEKSVKRFRKRESILAIVFFMIGIVFLGIKQSTIIRTGNENLFYLIEALQTAMLMLSTVFGMDVISKRLIVKPFVVIGKISYEIYLIHYFLIPKHPGYYEFSIFFLIVFVGSGLLYSMRNCITKKIKARKST